jgi:hypothetical protein
MRNHLHSAGIDLVETALDLIVPGSGDYSLGFFRDKKALGQPVSLIRRELECFFKEALGVRTHGIIVARCKTARKTMAKRDILALLDEYDRLALDKTLFQHKLHHLGDSFKGFYRFASGT